jgi:hypothetical protein
MFPDMPIRQKRRPCKHCKKTLPKNVMGRQRLYCSAACRQAVYRRRHANRAPLRLLQSDLWAIRDRPARARAAIRVLEELGYSVRLERGRSDATPRPGPVLTLIDGGKDDEPEEA